MYAARARRTAGLSLEASLGPAQAGAALRLIQTGFVRAANAARAAIDAVAPFVDAAFAPGTPGFKLLGTPLRNALELERAAAGWFAFDPAPQEAAAGGYWLADIFLRGTEPAEVAPLTRFLIGGTTVPIAQGRMRSIRRYPTGGLSEKQALILPPLLRAIAADMGWCSPFLVAKRLAHTGGTLDKLGTLPGFAPTSAAALAEWTGRPLPVLYVAAGEDLCPRDAAMYRMRGDTGTVVDHGLMAASILSKQAAAPVDGLVLDVLHGSTAFLRDLEDAIAFGELCIKVGAELGISVTTSYRNASAPMGRSVGASTEVLEAVGLLDPSTTDPRSVEIDRALGFVGALAGAAGLDGRRAVVLAKGALRSGATCRHLFDLWLDHGVDPAFVTRVARDPRSAILGQLGRVEVRAPLTGIVQCDWVALADVVNSRINGFQAAGDGPPKLNP
ncbi:MAG TPA: hypothetical protein VG274_08415, partial [Rhizomicrobium sp.]|nr:hypothetical protein [Rhizomicrobium sp.]